jgi:hypothetical protein
LNVWVIDNSLVNDEEQHFVEIFPNPSSGYLNIKNISEATLHRCTFYNQTGTEILVIEPANSYLDISGLKPGFYFLKLEIDEFCIWKKIIVVY